MVSLAPGWRYGVLVLLFALIVSGCGLETSGLQDPLSNTKDSGADGVTPRGAFVITPAGGLRTKEDGSKATFTVRLTVQPEYDVVLRLASNDASEATVGPEKLTFTAADWDKPQSVTVAGVDDELADGPQPVVIGTSAAESRDPRYDGVDPADVTVTNDDDDVAGIVVTPTTGLVTAEFGQQATFTVALRSRPRADVTIALSSDDTKEGTVAPASLTFTPQSWKTPQTVTVTGVDDAVADGTKTYHVVTAAAVSTDTTYAGLDGDDVTLTNTDDETPGITVTPIANLRTTEAGGTATFTIRLDSLPTADVKIDLSSNNTNEGTVSPSSVTFTTANWSTPRTITVTGVNDDVDDDDQSYSITTSPASSSDAKYSGIDPADVGVTNADDDTAGVTITPASNPLQTTEAGGKATFTVRLNSRPKQNVTIALSSSNTNEGTVGPSSLTFTTSNTSWSTPQTVTVTGVDDAVDDGNVAFTVVTGNASSTDPKYANMVVADVSLTNVDNDAAGITVSSISRHTTEAGGNATFTIRLDSQPAANVTIGLSSSNPNEGSVGASSVVFTTSNWNVAQTVTVTGVDDKIDDGDVSFSIVTAPAASSDPLYANVDAGDVSVVNDDDDTAAIKVSPTSGLTTTEAGGTAQFTVVLATQPTATITIPVSSSNTNEGTPSTNGLVFTTSNWNVAQTVTVTGKNDKVDDGDVQYAIQLGNSAGDAVYANIDPVDPTVTNVDDDTAGITVTPTSGLVTTERGGTASFTVVLDTQPTANVTIAVSSNDTQEGVPDKVLLTFTPSNWMNAQTVTVTGQNDTQKDGDKGYKIVTAQAGSTDVRYDNMNAADVDVTNWDDDTPGFRVKPTSGLVTTEAGGSASFTVALRSAPTGNVDIPVATSRPLEGTVSVATLTFTPANWMTPQTVVVTGQDDLLDDGDQSYSVDLGPAVSTDNDYNLEMPPAVGVTNVDND